MAYACSNNSNSLLEFKRVQNHSSGHGGGHGTSRKAESTSEGGFNHEPIKPIGHYNEPERAEFSGGFRQSQRNPHCKRRDIFRHSL